MPSARASGGSVGGASGGPVLPAAVVPVVERDHHRIGAEGRGDAVGQGQRRQRGRRVRRARHVGEAAHGLGERAEARARRVGPRLAEPRDVEHHEPAVHGPEVLVADPPAGQRAGPEVLDHHVDPGHEAAQEVLPLGHAEVERHAPLVARRGAPHEPDAVLLGSEPAHAVTAAGLLHLDDVGAELRQERRHPGPRGKRGDVEHREPVEGAPRFTHRPVLPASPHRVPPRPRRGRGA